VNLLREQSVLERRWGRAVDATEPPTDPALVNFRTPEDEVDREARMARLTSLIEALPPKLQAVLILQYRDELTYQQIAERIGVTTHTVKKYVMQGLALCRKRLSRIEGGAP
jgi:RNA polymerase sigma factor (sigma-70 family)